MFSYNDNNVSAKSERVYCLIGSLEKKLRAKKMLQQPDQIWRLLQDCVV